MKNLKINSIVLALVMLVSLSANAQQGKQNQLKAGTQVSNQKNCTQNGKKGFNLDLSEEQKTQMETLRFSLQKSMLPLKNELGEKKAKMKTLSTAEKADMKAINTLIDEMGAIKTQMAKQKASHKQEVRKILTEEQRIIFDSHKGRKGKGKGNCQANARGGKNGNGQGYKQGQS